MTLVTMYRPVPLAVLGWMVAFAGCGPQPTQPELVFERPAAGGETLPTPLRGAPTDKVSVGEGRPTASSCVSSGRKALEVFNLTIPSARVSVAHMKGEERRVRGVGGLVDGCDQHLWVPPESLGKSVSKCIKTNVNNRE